MPSSGILHRVDLVRTDTSEELNTSIIRVTRIGELGTLAITGNQHNLHKSALTRATQCNIPKDGIFHSPPHEYLKCYICILFLNLWLIKHFCSSWLMQYPGLLVRSSEPQYVDRVKKYNSRLMPLLESLQFTKGGPIIAFQVCKYYMFCKILVCKYKVGGEYVYMYVYVCM
jgi:hypothetical protein